MIDGHGSTDPSLNILARKHFDHAGRDLLHIGIAHANKHDAGRVGSRCSPGVGELDILGNEESPFADDLSPESIVGVSIGLFLSNGFCVVARTSEHGGDLSGQVLVDLNLHAATAGRGMSSLAEAAAKAIAD